MESQRGQVNMNDTNNNTNNNNNKNKIPSTNKK